MTPDRFWIRNTGHPASHMVRISGKDRETGRNGLRIDEPGLMPTDIPGMPSTVSGDKKSLTIPTEKVNQ